METAKSLYRQLRARSPHYTARDAIAAARRHIAGPLADYYAKLDAWQAEPDKRRFAPGGQANRPKYPQLYSARPEPSFLDGLRECGHVDELFPRRFGHRGWFADAFQDSVYRGKVWQLPARDGQCVYIAGYVEPESDYPVMVTCDDGSIELFTGDNPGNQYDMSDALKDAAIAADHLAERNAETQREYDEKWQEASAANDEREQARQELKASRACAVAAVKALRELRGLDVNGARQVCREQLNAARDDMREALESIAEHTAKIDDLEMSGEF